AVPAGRPGTRTLVAAAAPVRVTPPVRAVPVRVLEIGRVAVPVLTRCMLLGGRASGHGGAGRRARLVPARGRFRPVRGRGPHPFAVGPEPEQGGERDADVQRDELGRLVVPVTQDV